MTVRARVNRAALDARIVLSSKLRQLEQTVATTASAPNDRLVRRLLMATSRGPFGRLAGRGDGMTTALGATFTAAVRVIDRVHRSAADVRTTSHPSHAPRTTSSEVARGASRWYSETNTTEK